ncbi:caspase family protein [Phormidium sp. CLA17]|uniref:nSTAND1 domain-containing NTPase n=1 Tax=Leptolyngbya sp. Cla-17 TaxID=2803751 RepID=UPI0014918BCC|nr:caspase family protein [Leptolyngbya sp. Cla-17]MBM0743755.1 caspase family protein [Leptolyngbya sp. Cla-17]
MSRDALIVGVSSYQFLPSLNAPAHDAEAIAQQIETYGDFRVARLPEIVQAEKLRIGTKTLVTLTELETALVKLFKPKGNNISQTALFYFSGHGLQKEAGIREGYLATSDANPNANFHGLSLFWLRRLLQESPVRQRIVLLDCCHSGEILNFLEADPGAKSGTDRLFMAASRDYEAAYESLTGEYSVFTKALLEGLDPRRLTSGTITNYALTDWVSTTLKGESQQPLFENSGSEIILTRCQESLTTIQSSPSPEICPYRGLEPFQEGHAEYFFGREPLTDELLNKLRTGNFLAVVGASGSGKSSLVRAGLVHKLQRGQTLSGSNHWQIRLITPTEQPFKSLANAFINPAETVIDRAEQLRRAEMILQDGAGLTQLVKASLVSAPTKNARFVLIIDQFEEVFTLCQGAHADRDRHRLFNCLLTALKDTDNQFSVVIALRADFFSKCAQYQGLAEQIEHNLVMVTPLSYDQIKASILKPAEKVGLQCDPNLVYNMLLDIVGAPGELPLLQYTLLELWHRRWQNPDGGASRLTLDAYTELGGVRGTLQKRADEIFYSFTAEEQQVARRIFIALTQLGEGTEDTRRRVLKSELVSSHFSTELVEGVLEKLVISKLVVTNQVVPTNGYQQQIDQRLANVSTALRIAQVLRSKPRQVVPSHALRDENATESHSFQAGCTLNVERLSHVSDLETLELLPGETCQETVDIAHEALIRNWSLLRTWLDENREMLRRQRRIERTAREWYGTQQSRSLEYLLQGSHLVDAEDFLNVYPHELSSLAQRYVSISREESYRSHREMRLLQITIPCALLMALGVTFNQYRVALTNEKEKDYQLQVATSRQWSAIAQSILQEPDSDPTPALLISRLAAERGHTYEAEASLRAALQKLRLQAILQADKYSIQQIAVSPNQQILATLDAVGTVRLWALKTQTVEQVWQIEVPKPASTGIADNKESPSMVKGTIAFTSDGKLVTSSLVGIQIWSAETGKLLQTLGDGQSEITHLTLSPDGDWLAVATRDSAKRISQGNRSLRVWQISSGKLHLNLFQPADVHSIDFSPDGKFLAIASGTTATLWQVQTGQQKYQLSHATTVNQAVFSPDGTLIATAAEDGTRLWQVKRDKLRQTLTSSLLDNNHLAQPSSTTQVAFSPNGQTLASVKTNGQVQVWGLKSGQGQGQIQSGSQWHTAVRTDLTRKDPQKVAIAFSPNNQQIAISTSTSDRESSTIAIRELSTGHEVSLFQERSHTINVVQFSSDGSSIMSANADGSVRFWTVDIDGELPTLETVAEPMQWSAFQPSVIQTPSTAHSSLQASRPPVKTAAKDLPSGMVAISPNGNWQQWELIKQPFSPSPNNHTCQTKGATRFSASCAKKTFQEVINNVGNEFFALGSKLYKRWQPLSSETPAIQSLPGASITQQPLNHVVTMIKSTPANMNLVKQITNGAKLTSTAFNADHTLLAIADDRGTVELLQVATNQALTPWRSLQAPITTTQPSTKKSNSSSSSVVRQLAFSPDGLKLVGTGTDRAVRVWNVSTGKLLHRLSGHKGFIEQAQFSPDGQQIISASWDRTIRIWDSATGSLLTTFSHNDAVTSVQYSPDGQRLAITSLDGTAQVLDSQTGTVRVIMAGHRGAVLDANFSPDGQVLVTASADGTARLWDVNTGTEKSLLRPFKATEKTDPIKRAFFSSDGQYVATLNENGKLRLWTVHWQSLLELARDRSLRQLTPEECLRYLRLIPNACPSLPLNSISHASDDKKGF